MKMIVEYIKELHGFSPRRFWGCIILMAVLGLLEGVGVLILIPLLGVAGIIPGLTAGAGLAAGIGGFFHKLGLQLTLLPVLAVYLAVNLGQHWLQRYQTLWSVDIQQSFCRHLSIRLFKAIAYAQWELLLTRAKSDMTHALFSEIMQIGAAAMSVLGLIAAILVTAVQVALAFLIAPTLTCAMLTAAMVLFFLLRPFLWQSREQGRKIMEGNRTVFADLTEHLQGIKEVKSYSIEAAQVENFSRQFQTLTDNVQCFHRLQTRTDMLYKMGSAVFVSLFLFVAIAVFRLRPDEFILITLISARLWPRFSSLQAGMQSLQLLLPSFQSVRQLEQECFAARENLPNHAEERRWELTRGMELRDISFGYNAAKDKYAVAGVRLTLPAGTTTAFVGVSGAGKSTLVDVLLGLLTPQQGEILIDGKPLTRHLGAWRNSIGYVAQDPFLINASLRDNLRWASPQASDGEIWEALRLAAADAFVRALPDGLSTLVGDRGVRLSGGERQRIVLARALLRKPSVLILDEATSALDAENEQRIQQALESLQGRLTIVLIAHRLSTIRHADQIFVLEQGRIVEYGDYQSLTANSSSRFFSLAVSCSQGN